VSMVAFSLVDQRPLFERTARDSERSEESRPERAAEPRAVSEDVSLNNRERAEGFLAVRGSDTVTNSV
jgi:hypothetical protein